MIIEYGAFMSFKHLKIKRWYSSNEDDVLFDFYIPVLEESVEYLRLAGFFSSSALAVASRGILGLIRNNGRMKLLVSPKLSKEDVEAILRGELTKKKCVDEILLKFGEDLFAVVDDFEKKHLEILSWMVAKGTLELKVVVVEDRNGVPLDWVKIEEKGIFHQKVGIFTDEEGNKISFSGSVNETAQGWLENIEEFKVFRSWCPVEEDYVKADLEKFWRYWTGNARRISTYSLPEALRKRFVEFAPKELSYTTASLYIETPEPEELMDSFWERRKKKEIRFRPYQKEAIEAWRNNGFRGILEMATGTGKTITALGCVKELHKEEKSLIVFVVVPTSHLITQWKEQIERFDFGEDDVSRVFVCSGYKWKERLVDLLRIFRLRYGEGILFVLCTYNTFSENEFINIARRFKRNLPILLLADEVHWAGAKKWKEGLLESYEYRLGVSATPLRWYDEEGTRKLFDYFGGTVFSFSLKEALSEFDPETGQSYLTPFRYFPKACYLTDEELERYRELTLKILKAIETGSESELKSDSEVIRRLLFKRAEIVKNAVGKFDVLKEILSGLGKDVKHLIVYCTPEQLKKTISIIKEFGLRVHKFTMEENSNPSEEYCGFSEREYILKLFEEGKYQVLVAMKCLDEGVDIPSARTIVLMSSGGNPREYIQRIGRILRRFPGKKEAEVYDIIVVPELDKFSEDLKRWELKIFRKEMKRIEEIISWASNRAEALKRLYHIVDFGGGKNEKRNVDGCSGGIK